MIIERLDVDDHSQMLKWHMTRNTDGTWWAKCIICLNQEVLEWVKMDTKPRSIIEQLYNQHLADKILLGVIDE